mmetsp:Transcript_7713/g.12778  ORF Transcript_7713/g.12778 Transcript_7713/m.12778 type:complete len:280 (+) Transcript_7713:3-842(+)
MDDDLMSIAQSIARSAQGTIEAEKAPSAPTTPVKTTMGAPLDGSTFEFDSDRSVGNVSHVSGLTRNTSPRKPAGLTLKTGFEDDRGETDARASSASVRGPPQKPMDTIGSQQPPKVNRRLPPRPGSNEKRPPMSPGGTLSSARKSSMKKSAPRRGPPRPEEGSRGGTRRNKDDARSVSPGHSPRAQSSNREKLSVSLDHIRDRDDVSIISEGGYSKTETVASDALDTILTRIEDCKSVLASTPKTEEDFAKQLEMAGMIEKLASAAVAVRKLEELGINY